MSFMTRDWQPHFSGSGQEPHKTLDKPEFVCFNARVDIDRTMPRLRQRSRTGSRHRHRRSDAL